MCVKRGPYCVFQSRAIAELTHVLSLSNLIISVQITLFFSTLVMFKCGQSKLREIAFRYALRKINKTLILVLFARTIPLWKYGHLYSNKTIPTIFHAVTKVWSQQPRWLLCGWSLSKHITCGGICCFFLCYSRTPISFSFRVWRRNIESKKS